MKVKLKPTSQFFVYNGLVLNYQKLILFDKSLTSILSEDCKEENCILTKRHWSHHHVHEELRQNKGCDPAHTDAQS